MTWSFDPHAAASFAFRQYQEVTEAGNDGLQILAPRRLQTIFIRGGDPSHIAGLSQGGAHFR
jgi:hypothetical protein